MAMKTRAIFSIVISLFFACEERIDLPIQSKDTELLVVEGVLTNENINHKVKLTLPYQSINGKGAPASGAVVLVAEGNSKVYTLSEQPAGAGEYYTPMFRAVFGEVYTLYILYKGKEYVAQDSSVPVEPLTPLDYRRVNDQYTLVINGTGEDANYIDHSISWKNTPACLPESSCEGRIVFYDLKSIDVNEIAKPGKTEFLFPAGSTIIRKKYSVSSTYRSFLRSVLSETEWRGGVFDVDRVNATTNLSAGAIGFFAVTTVVSDTTLVVEKP